MFLYCFLLYILREETHDFLSKLQHLNTTLNTAKALKDKQENMKLDYLKLLLLRS